jgi:hypothetical protein
MNVGARLDKITCIMTECFVLHSSAALVDLGVGVLYYVKWIGDERRVRENFIKDALVGSREINGARRDARAPLGPPSAQPLLRGFGLSIRHDVEELGALNVDDRRHELQCVFLTGANHQVLVEPERRDVAEATGVFNQRFAVSADGVIDGVPVTAELLG